MVKYAATLALFSVAVMCGTLSYSIVTVNKHLSATLMKLDESLDKLNGKNGLIQELGKTVVDTKHLIGDADIAENDEISQIAAWNNQISQTLTDLHNVAVSAQSAVDGIRPVETAATESLQQSTVTIQALQTSAKQLSRDLESIQPVIAHTDALVSNPALTATISNVESTTGHLDATAADVQQEVHSLTHPTWLHKLWGGLLDVAHVFNPL